MKILTLSLFLFPLALCAQFSKGDKYITANFNFSANNPSGDNGPFNASSYHSLGITPGYGYFINNNLAIGSEVGYSYSHQRFEQGTGLPAYKYNSYNYSVAPFIRKYWAIGDKFLFSVKAYTSYSRGASDLQLSSEPRRKSYGLSAGISPSFAFFPTRHWSIETTIASMYYNFSKRLGHKTHYDSFGVSYGYINFGVAYYFRQ